MNADHKTTKGLRISKLAELADVSPATVKHYLNEGLLPKPVKTGKTMSWYDPSCVERIRLIKRLQREKFLPLDVIRRIIGAGTGLEDEIEIGRVVAGSGADTPETSGPVTEKEAVRRTGLSREKIHVLAEAEIIHPEKSGSGRIYGGTDLKIMELARKREEYGLPFDYAADIMKIYARAVEQAVREDSRRFVRSQVGRVSTGQALRLMTQANADLDEFIVLIRGKLQRSIGRSTLRELDRLGELAGRINPLPVTGKWLPERGPEEHLFLYHLLAGNYAAALGNAAMAPAGIGRTAAAIVCRLFAGDKNGALDNVEAHLPEPSDNPWSNAAAALAFAMAAPGTAGLTNPVYLARRALDYLETEGPTGPAGWFYRYVRGAVLSALPEVFGTREDGLKELTGLRKDLHQPAELPENLPKWLKQTATEELLPEVLARIDDLAGQSE